MHPRKVMTTVTQIRLVALLFVALVLLGPVAGMAADPSSPKELGKSAWKPGWLTVTFVDVGKGDATVIRLPDGKTCLVDTGYAETTEKLFRAMAKRGVDALDLLVLTHFHKDHVGGYGAVIEHVKVKQVIKPFDPRDDRRKLMTRPGDVVMKGEGYEMTVLAPRTLFRDENDSSLVLRLTYGDHSFLLAADVVAEGQADLLMRKAPLAATVLKVPHHGDYKGFSPRPFFAAVKPQYAVITCNADDGAPPEGSVIEMLRELGAQVYRSDEHGNVGFRSDGKTLTLLP